MSSTQVAVNVNHDNIRQTLANRLSKEIEENAVLSEQVQSLAADKMNLEDRVRQLESLLQPAESGEVIDAPQTPEF
ncbi:hypothetical protein WBU96_28270 [Bacillus albus]|uniref:hypothetical protein n=1 Tax=Bacillus albus TaxID=2026189 RepID=UPI0030146BCF